MTRHLLVAFLPFAVFASITSACSYDLCEYAPCENLGDGGSGADGNDGAGAQGAGGEGAGGSPSNFDCDFVNGKTVGDECGVFVDAEFEGKSEGTKAAPFTTVTEAVAASTPENPRIYVCGPRFTESVSLSTGRQLRGGYDCVAWQHDEDAKTELTAPPDEIPLTLNGGEIRVEGFIIRADDAQDSGGSSIAIVADNASADLERVEIYAGNAKAGAGGAMGMTGAIGGSGGSTGSTGFGSGGVSSCGAGGGAGGSGGGAGMSGQPGSPAQGNPGVTSGGTCMAGGPGGAPGTVGPGDDATTGAIDVNGYSPPNDATVGLTGLPGGGGGGGGGDADGGGGGGAAGGCGGLGGRPGKSGGSSIAIVWLNAALRFSGSKAEVGLGGDGGDGGSGGMGGAPGTIGDSTLACDGGIGMTGGTGGRGGHGAGGHALIVAYLGDAPPDLEGLAYTTPDDQGGDSEGLPGESTVSMDFDP